jgi:hypothetical protein
MFDHWPLFVRCLIGFLGPPITTAICWWASPLLLGRKQKRKRNRTEFWLMLLAAYMVFAIALLHNKIPVQNKDDDPSQLVR